MDQITRSRYEARAKIIKALAHPSRLLIVDRLAQQRHCVCELTDMIGSDASTVSKHLTVLKNAGIVKDEKIGASVFYELVTPCIMQFLGCVETVIKANATIQMELIS